MLGFEQQKALYDPQSGVTSMEYDLSKRNSQSNLKLRNRNILETYD